MLDVHVMILNDVKCAVAWCDCVDAVKDVDVLCCASGLCDWDNAMVCFCSLVPVLLSSPLPDHMS